MMQDQFQTDILRAVRDIRNQLKRTVPEGDIVDDAKEPVILSRYAPPVDDPSAMEGVDLEAIRDWATNQEVDEIADKYDGIINDQWVEIDRLKAELANVYKQDEGFIKVADDRLDKIMVLEKKERDKERTIDSLRAKLDEMRTDSFFWEDLAETRGARHIAELRAHHKTKAGYDELIDDCASLNKSCDAYEKENVNLAKKVGAEMEKGFKLQEENERLKVDVPEQDRQITEQWETIKRYKRALEDVVRIENSIAMDDSARRTCNEIANDALSDKEDKT